jgi:hypothetical protein
VEDLIMPSPSSFKLVQSPPPIDIPAIFGKTGDEQINRLLAPIQPDAPFDLLGRFKEPCDAEQFKSRRWHQRHLRAGDNPMRLRICSYDFRGDAGVGSIRNLGGSQVELSVITGSSGKCIVMYETHHPVVTPYLTATVDVAQMVLVSICVGEPVKPSEVDIEIVMNAGFGLNKLITAGDAENLGFDFAKIQVMQR